MDKKLKRGTMKKKRNGVQRKIEEIKKNLDFLFRGRVELLF
jgi:hypothetical protein